ncbi:putative membrane protein [Bartonella australis AUST/NH1]|uniref:Putative membrane protein n=1 Tax=Bartonella australis (strain Aust/NH1) TaxID=1094489 RepID=M1N3U5_BARAA|nr:YgcG family protein [Bartonella australis]AGF74574.1 putative membrane protein [Bartonella australis AUST/NH1]
MIPSQRSIQYSFFPYLWVVVCLFCCSIPLGSSVAYPQGRYPSLTGRINDVARLLDDATIEDLTKKLAALEEKAGDQVVVVTIPSLSGMDIETYSNSLFRIWSLGQKQINNGVLLVVAPNERRVRIEVGYGLEGELTDAISTVIINNFILPNFREGNYRKGIIEAIDAIINVITNNDSDFTYRIKEQAKIIEIKRKQAEKEQMIANAIIFLVFFAVIGLPILAMIFGKKVGPQKYRWMGIVFTPWFIGLNFGRGEFGKRSSGGKFRGGGGSSGGGGASGRW